MVAIHCCEFIRILDFPKLYYCSLKKKNFKGIPKVHQRYVLWKIQVLRNMALHSHEQIKSHLSETTHYTDTHSSQKCWGRLHSVSSLHLAPQQPTKHLALSQAPSPIRTKPSTAQRIWPDDPGSPYGLSI